MYPFLIEWTGTGGTGMSGPVLVSTNTIPFVVIEFFYAPLRRSRGVGRRAQCCALGSSAPLREGLRGRCGAEGQLGTMAADGAKEEYAEIGGNDDQEKGYELPKDASVTDYLLWPWRSMEGFFERFIRNFGWKFAVQIAVM